jgi:hypothetical protein
MHFFASAILCVEPSIHAWRRSFHLLRREISQPFAQDTCVTCHMHSLVNLLLGIGHHPSLKSQSVSFVFHFLNWIMLYYDAFFTRGILGHRPLTFFVTSHTTGSVHQPQDGKCTPATIWHCVHQPLAKRSGCHMSKYGRSATVPLCSIEYPPKATRPFFGTAFHIGINHPSVIKTPLSFSKCPATPIPIARACRPQPSPRPRQRPLLGQQTEFPGSVSM